MGSKLNLQNKSMELECKLSGHNLFHSAWSLCRTFEGMELAEPNVDVAVVWLQQNTYLSLSGDCATVLGCKDKNDLIRVFVLFSVARVKITLPFPLWCLTIPGCNGQDDFAVCLWCLFLGTGAKMTLPCVCDVCSWLREWRWLCHVCLSGQAQSGDAGEVCQWAQVAAGERTGRRLLFWPGAQQADCGIGWCEWQVEKHLLHHFM